MQFKQTELSNGLTILGEASPAAASMAVGFFARTGSRDETASIAGVYRPALAYLCLRPRKFSGSAVVNTLFP